MHRGGGEMHWGGETHSQGDKEKCEGETQKRTYFKIGNGNKPNTQ